MTAKVIPVDEVPPVTRSPHTSVADGSTTAGGDGNAAAKTAKMSRTKRLFAVVGVVVVSWLIVKVWADVFELFVRKVLRVRKSCFVSNLLVAITFTGGMLWLLYMLDIDHML